MTALAMAYKLHRLHQRHGVQKDAMVVPLSPSTSDPVTIVHGLASTAEVDLDRCSFAPGSLYWTKTPTLYLKHREATPVGTITNLTYRPNGELLITASVTDPTAARYNAFSIGANVKEYSLHDEHTPAFRAVVHRAEITEVSLTDVPCCVGAVVRSRHSYRVPPTVAYYDLVLSLVKGMQSVLHVVERQLADRQQPPPRRPPPRSRSSFSMLVDHLHTSTEGETS